jgi:hypothetical protein
MSRTSKPLATFVVTTFMLASCPVSAPALGIETFGSRPLQDPAYEEWSNLTSVINLTNRLYQRWVNGGESFFFQGNTEALNEALRCFALIQMDVREVILLPGPANVYSLMRQKRFDYDWSLKLNSGITRTMMSRGKGGLIWRKDPVLTIFVGGGNIVLDQIHIPKGGTVLEMSDLLKRYTQAIQESEDIHVRGWGAGELAKLDPFSTASVGVVASLLRDTNDWVQSNAAIELKIFGKTAASALPSLRRTAETSIKYLKEQAQATIAAIEAAPDMPPAEQQKRARILEEISAFRKVLPQGK